jgi:NAD(P)H-dependent FMN reductase
MGSRKCRLLFISGSLRSGSVNGAALRTALDLLPAGTTAHLYPGMDRLPHFNPDLDREPLPQAVRSLRDEIGRADGILFSTPEYAGALPGAFKNVLDWTVGGGEMDRKAVAWINTAGPAAPSGGEGAHASLRTIVGYLGAYVVEAACARIPVSRRMVAPRGDVGEAVVVARLAAK